MIRLIRSNLLRAYRNLIVWVSVVLQFCITFFYTLIYKLTNPLYSTADSAFFTGFTLLVFPFTGMITIFACITVLAADFDNRAIVLKLQAGFSKYEIYLAGFLSSIIIGLTLYATHLVTYCVISIPVLGKPTMPTEYLTAVLAISLLSKLVYAALSVFSVSVCRKTVNSLCVALGVLLFTTIMMFFSEQLPEYAYMLYDCVHAYTPGQTEDIVDSMYGYMHWINFKITAKSEFFYNFFIAGNASKIFYCSPLNLWQIIPFAIAKITFLFGTGFIVAGRRDIK